MTGIQKFFVGCLIAVVVVLTILMALELAEGMREVVERIHL